MSDDFWAEALALYGQSVTPSATLMPVAWAGLESWEFAPKGYALKDIMILPLVEDDE